MAGTNTNVRQVGGSGYKRSITGAPGVGMYQAATNAPGVNPDWLSTFIKSLYSEDYRARAKQLSAASSEADSFKNDLDSELQAIKSDGDLELANAKKVSDEEGMSLAEEIANRIASGRFASDSVPASSDVMKKAMTDLGRKFLTSASAKTIDTLIPPTNTEPVVASGTPLSSVEYEEFSPKEEFIPTAEDNGDIAPTGPVGVALGEEAKVGSVERPLSPADSGLEGFLERAERGRAVTSRDALNKKTVLDEWEGKLSEANTSASDSSKVDAATAEANAAREYYESTRSSSDWDKYSAAVDNANASIQERNKLIDNYNSILEQTNAYGDEFNSSLAPYNEARTLAEMRENSMPYVASDYFDASGKPTNLGTFARSNSPTLGETTQGFFGGANDIYSGITNLQNGNPMGALNIASGGVNLAKLLANNSETFNGIVGNTLNSASNVLGAIGGVGNVATGVYDMFTGDTSKEKISGGVRAGTGAATLAGKAGMLPASVNTSIGAAAPVMAIITAANMARNAWGGTNKDYAEKNNRERFFDDPVVGPVTSTIGSVFGDKSAIARPFMKIGDSFSHYAGGPISKALNLDFKGAINELNDAIPNTWEAFGVKKEIADPIYTVMSGGVNKIVKALTGGTHLCTATSKHSFLYVEEAAIMKALRKYAFKNHRGWMRTYIKHGKKLIKAIEEKEQDIKKYYTNMRKILIEPVVQIYKVDIEGAYQLYKEITFELVKKYLPEFDLKEEK